MSQLSARRFLRDDLAWVAVTGDDRLRFLHALLTADLQGLEPGQGARSLLLTDKGKITADCRVLVDEAQVLLGCEAPAREGLLAALDHYLVADDVELEALEVTTHQVIGEAGALLPQLSLPLPEGALSHAAAGGWRIVREGLGERPGLLLVGDGALPAPLAELPEGTAAEREALRIAAGQPAFQSELAAGVFPQEVGLEELLHALKGCYLGQETMVRIGTQGHVNWVLAGLRSSGGLPSPGDAVSPANEPGKKVGEITSAARLPGTEQPLALARLRHEHAADGTALTVATREGALAATVVPLPFA